MDQRLDDRPPGIQPKRSMDAIGGHRHDGAGESVSWGRGLNVMRGREEGRGGGRVPFIGNDERAYNISTCTGSSTSILATKFQKTNQTTKTTQQAQKKNCGEINQSHKSHLTSGCPAHRLSTVRCRSRWGLIGVRRCSRRINITTVSRGTCGREYDDDKGG